MRSWLLAAALLAACADPLVYHGRDYRDINGDPLNDPNRHTRLQPFSFDALTLTPGRP